MDEDPDVGEDVSSENIFRRWMGEMGEEEIGGDREWGGS